MPDLSALILTYNEGPNIGMVVEKVLVALRRLDPQATVVVVDGGSKDGTQANAEAAGATVFLQREKGYGAAFSEGLAHMRSDFILTLDADLSHDPELAVKLWEQRHAADIVIASRYTEGGSADLSPFRRFLSWFMNGTYRRVLELPIRDMSSGLRLYRRRAVEGLDLVSHDFDVLEEVLVKAYNRGFRVLEIPFHFAPRLHGESHLQVVKFGLSYYRTLVRLSRIRHSPQAADRDVRARRSLVPTRRLWAWRRRHLIRRLRQRSSTLLDIGATASALGAQADGGCHGTLEGRVIAVDAGLERLRAIRSTGVPCLLVDPHHLPFPDGSMPAVLCSSPQFSDDEACRELHRVLAPDGSLVVLPDRGGEDVEKSLRLAGFTVSTRPLPPGPAVLTATRQTAGEVGVVRVRCPFCQLPLAWNGEGPPAACVCGRSVDEVDGGYDFRPARV